VSPDLSHKCIIDLGKLCQWLGKEAQALGIEVYFGFEATALLVGDDGQISGVRGSYRTPHQAESFPGAQPPNEISARQTIFAEGCRGVLKSDLSRRFKLHRSSSSPGHAVRIFEVWTIDPAKHRPGLLVRHTARWSNAQDTENGCYLYHLPGDRLALNFVDGLNFRIPWRSPLEDFERYKAHPSIREQLTGGTMLRSNARAVLDGMPQLHFPGGVLVGDTAGFVNASNVKSAHLAMKSGIDAADAIVALLAARGVGNEARDYGKRVRDGWAWDELQTARPRRSACSPNNARGSSIVRVSDTRPFTNNGSWLLHHQRHPINTFSPGRIWQ
jgi:electron-transferring-flavoprotein dehydrogenase